MKNQDIENELSMNEFLKWLNKVNKDRQCKDEQSWQGKWSATEKNQEIKEKFAKEFAKFPGKTGKIKCRYSDPNDRENSEFLYDFSVIEWKKQEGEYSEEPSLLRTILAMELEFSEGKLHKGWKGGIKYDFHKLLQADAPYKILAFWMHDKKERDIISKALDELEAAARAYKNRCNSKLLLWGVGSRWDGGDGEREKRRVYEREIDLTVSP